MDDEYSMSFRVKELRETLGMTQTEFGKALGTTQQTVCHWERSSRNLRSQPISNICARFDVNERWLRMGEGEMFKQTAGAAEIARQLQRTIVQRIFAAMPKDVQDTIIEICRVEETNRKLRQIEARKAMEEADAEVDQDDSEL